MKRSCTLCFVTISVLFGLAGCLRQAPPPLLPLPQLDPLSVAQDIYVSASTDDAEEYQTGSVTLGSSTLELVYNGDKGNQTVGLRFTGVNVPKGATITHAYIQFTTRTPTSDAASLEIRGQADDNPATFGSTRWMLTNRPKTGASVAWSPPAWPLKYQAGSDQRTPNLAAIAQEIIERPGWASGNAMAFYVTGSGQRIARSFDGDATLAPALHLEYVSGTVSNGAPVVNAGADRTVSLSNPANLSGSADDDGLPVPPGAVTTTWSKVSGPGAVSFVAKNALRTTATFSAAGSYVLKLTADDGELSASDNVALTVLAADGNAVTGLSQVNYIRMGADHGATRGSGSCRRCRASTPLRRRTIHRRAGCSSPTRRSTRWARRTLTRAATSSRRL